MPGLHQVVSGLRRVDRDLDRPGAVVRRDPGRDPLARLDRDRERRAVRRLVALGHHPQPERIAALAGEAEADQAAALLGHERDRLRRRELPGDRQVAFVLAVGRVDDDDHLSLADLLDRLLDGRECGRAHFVTRRSTYFASTSTSRLTGSPGASAPSVVAANVCGTSATAKPSSSSAATVSEVPSTAIEPFSTQ